MSAVVERLAERLANERAATAARYFELLGRANDPQEGDDAAIAECLTALGRTLANVTDDLAAVERLRTARAEAANIEALAAEAQAAAVHRAAEENTAVHEKAALAAIFRGRMEAADLRVSRAETAWRAAQRAAHDIQSAQDTLDAIARGVPVDQVRSERIKRQNEGTRILHGPGNTLRAPSSRRSPVTPTTFPGDEDDGA